jgi:hypothetical protein
METVKTPVKASEPVNKSVNESRLVSDIIRATYPFVKLFRANVGRVKLPDGRWFSTGLPKGYPDLCGYHRATGRAVYIECKMPYNKPSEEQLKFIDEARAAGAIAAVCYSVQEAVELVTKEL